MASFIIRIPSRSARSSGGAGTTQQNGASAPIGAPAPIALPPAPPAPPPVPPPAPIAGLPSAGWLRNPAWVDGGVNPPRFYTTAAEIQDAIRAAANAGIHVAPAIAQPPQGNAAPTAAPEPEHARVQAVANANQQFVGLQGTGNAQAHAPLPNDAPIDTAGHLVYVTHSFSPPDKLPPARSTKTVPKKKPITTTKFEYIKMDGMTRSAFIKAFLRVHELHKQFSAGVHSGPEFKLWWTGSNGGKAGALTIDNDRDFTLAVATLMQKNRRTCAVSIEFDTDNMDGFRIRKALPNIVADDVAGSQELVYGTRVPRVESFSNEAQLHGPIILELKEKWACQQHAGEHGELGYCYITANAEHVGLNMRKLKFWAAAIAAHDATKHDPPNTLEFDGIRDGRLSLTRSRGRSGPGPASISGSMQSSDTSQLLMAAILSNLNTNGKRTRSPSPQPPRTPTRPRTSVIPPSPLPKKGSELQACLADFNDIKGIDLTGCADAFASVDFMPDVIPDVPIARLCELTGASEGRVVKLQVFCRAWSARLEEKRAFFSDKRRRFD